MDPSADNPFADLMNKAVKLKSAQQAQLRPLYDSWPEYFQHSLFMQKEITELRDKSFVERIQAAEELKASGNSQLDKDALEEAASEYEKALAIFKYCDNMDPGWKKKGIEDKDLQVFDYKCDDQQDRMRLDALKTACYLNLAMVKFRMKEYNVCIHACSDALEIDSTNVKAYYRRAQARISPASSGAVEFEDAIKDLQKAYAIDPGNRAVHKLLLDLQAQKVKQKKLDRDTFSGMFNRGQVYTGNQEHNKSKVSRTKDEDLKAKFEKEAYEAEALARLCEKNGRKDQAEEIRSHVKKAKDKKTKQPEFVDFFNPTQEMINDAKTNGIDLTDPSVQEMLHKLQLENNGHPAEEKFESRDRSMLQPSADDLLNRMTNEEMYELIRAEGIDPHGFAHQEDFIATARHILRQKLDDTQTPAWHQKSYFTPVVMIGVAWTLLRLWSSGGLSFLIKAAIGYDAKHDEST